MTVLYVEPELAPGTLHTQLLLSSRYMLAIYPLNLP